MSEADMIIESLKNSGKKVEEFYMSNKTSDKNVGSIEKISQTSDNNVANIEDDVNELKSIMNLRTESGFAYSQKNTLKLQKSIRNVLAEREQDKKRIQELEEESRKKSIELICYQEELENSIPTQVVLDKIDEHNEKIEKYNEYREQGKETDVEYYENITNTAIVQVLTKILEGEK